MHCLNIKRCHTLYHVNNRQIHQYNTDKSVCPCPDWKLKVSPSQHHVKEGSSSRSSNSKTAMEPPQCHVQAHYNTQLMPCQSD